MVTFGLFDMDTYELWHYKYAMLCKYVGSAGVLFLFYDHLLTFADEVQYIWRAKNTFPKILFLLVRYLVPAALVLNIYQLSGAALHNDHATLFCQISFNVAVCIGIFSIGIGNFLVLLRLFLLWKKNRKLVVYTLVVFAIAQVGIVVCAIVVLVNVTPSLTFDTELKICMLQERSILGALYVPPAILDGVALLAVSWNAFVHPRTADEGRIHLLYTERFGYLLILFFMRLVNLATTLFAPNQIVFLGICFIWATTTVAVSRLIIDLRKNCSHTASKAIELPTLHTPSASTSCAGHDAHGYR